MYVYIIVHCMCLHSLRCVYYILELYWQWI